jgi:hypothetical protein
MMQKSEGKTLSLSWKNAEGCSSVRNNFTKHYFQYGWKLGSFAVLCLTLFTLLSAKLELTQL